MAQRTDVPWGTRQDLERAVVGHRLALPEWRELWDRVNPAWLGDPWRRYWDWAEEQARLGQPSDFAAMARAFPAVVQTDWAALLDAIAAIPLVPEGVHVVGVTGADLVTILGETVRRDQLRSATRRAWTRLSGDEPTDDVVADLQAALAQDAGAAGTPLPDFGALALEWLNAPPSARVRWPVLGLDRTLGPLEPGTVILLAARPGVGKSSLALQTAYGALAGHPRRRVGIASYEMPLGHVLAHWLAPIADATLAQAVALPRALAEWSARQAHPQTDGPTTLPPRLDRLVQALTRIADLPAVVWTQPMTWPQLVRAVRQAHRDRPLDLLVIDYADLIRPEDPRERRVETLGRVAFGCKDLAKELGLPVLLLAQGARDQERREDRRPRLSDLRWSGDLEAAADQVLFLWRPDPEHPADLRAVVVKNRMGPLGEVALGFDGPQGMVRDVAGATPRPQAGEEAAE